MALTHSLRGFRNRCAWIVGFAAVAIGLASKSAEAQQFLMMPDSAAGNFRMVLFDTMTGALVNSNYFSLNGATNSTPIHGLQVGNEIWVSEQIGDRIGRYDLMGNFLGQIGGGATGGLDNIRGMGLVGNTVYVTNGGAGNGAPSASSVVMFDMAGNNIGNFSTAGTAPSPFGILGHQGGILVSSSSANDDIHRFSLSGVSQGTFHNSTLAFVEQMDHAFNGDVLAAIFTTGVIARLNPNDGSLLGSFAASGARGVHQLGNGNIMWTSGAGVFVYDVTAGISTNVYATTGGRYIDLLTIPEPSSIALVGLGAILCACWRRRAKAAR